jgi:uncharacterized coiled-coil protein SlyX
MSILTRRKPPTDDYVAGLEETIGKMQERLADLQLDRDILEAIKRQDIPQSLWFLQRKTTRQRKALDRLNRRVVSQRFVLRTLDGLGRSLTRDEYVAARDAEPEQLRERIDEAE